LDLEQSNNNENDSISTKDLILNVPPVEKLISEKKENKQHFNRFSYLRNRINNKAEEKKKENLETNTKQKTSLKHFIAEPFKLKVLINKYSNINAMNVNGSSSNVSSNSLKSKNESQINTICNRTYKSDSIFSNSNKSNSRGNIQNTSVSIIKTQIQASNDSNLIEDINEKIVNNNNFNLNENTNSVLNIQDSNFSLFKTIIEKPNIDPFLHVLFLNKIKIHTAIIFLKYNLFLFNFLN